MKVLYLATRSPYPTSGGREFMIAQSLKFLVQDNETHLICFRAKKDFIDAGKLQKIGLSHTEFLEIPSFFKFIMNVIFTRKSLQESLYFSSKNRNFILDYINILKPDVVICDMVRTAQFMNDINVPYIVDLDDILSSRYERMLAAGASYSIMGTYSQRLPSFLKSFEAVLRKSVLRYEIKKLRKAEQFHYENALATILTSEKEADYLNQFFCSNKAFGIPQAVSVKEKKPCNSRNILFIGNLTTAQNLASLEYIVSTLLPELDSLNCSYHLDVIGRYDSRAMNLTKNCKRVTLHGFVEDFTSVVENCRMSIGHVAFGTGIKTKILDTLALGLPTVTNTVGAEGLSLCNKQNIIISDDYKVQALEIKNILDVDSYAERLSVEGQKYVVAKHSFDILKNRYLKLIDFT